LTFWNGKIVSIQGKKRKGKKREIAGMPVLPLGVSMRWKLYSTLRGIVGPVLAQTRETK
jgi:hypothetical protein